MATSSRTTPSARWRTWFLWVCASTIGLVLGVAVSLPAVPALGEILASIAMGALAGLAQWLVIRSELEDAGWWLVVNAMAVPLGVAVNLAVHSTRPLSGSSLFLAALGMVALGLVVGSAQWLVLRRTFRRAGWWVPANAVGWCAGALVAQLSGTLLARVIGLSQLSDFLLITFSFAAIGCFAGIATGAAWAFLFRHRVPSRGRRVHPTARLAVAACALAVVAVLGTRQNLSRGLTDPGIAPDSGPGSTCSDLPPPACVRSDTHCADLLPFEPVSGSGYVNYPVNGETWDNQYRSYLSRDLMMLVKYAAARVACESEGWDYRRLKTLGLGDMSEADGAIPGTSLGRPAHPAGTHEDGQDIDLAYFQLDDRGIKLSLDSGGPQVEGNLLKIVCKHTRYGVELYHCTAPPHLVDPWRTALFVAHLSEHSRLRLIIVDGQIGPVLEAALDQLVRDGWIDANLRGQIPLRYELSDQGRGYFRHHHHHMHISLEG